ncbi:MAG: radical SAM protein [Thermoplasmatales archaeon]|nr:radical SAM protein [Thermoplasmatales archaeon]
MRYVYGPVPSRRLGKSFGVSPIPPKTCSYSCVYCQLGRTNRFQIKREDFYPKEEIFKEIEKVMKTTKPDYITFAGDGEPTLCKSLGWLVNKCKKKFSTPVAVITNSSLLFMPDVRKDLSYADVVLPSLDAGNESIFKKINRPYKGISFEEMVNGIIKLRNEYKGEIWMETMLVKNVNDSDKALIEIKKCLEKINPDQVYINVPIRPPAESWALPPSPERIVAAHQIIGQIKEITEIEVGDFGLSEFKSAEEAILKISQRHPLREEQAKGVEKHFRANVIESLISSGKIVRVEYRNKKFLVVNR